MAAAFGEGSVTNRVLPDGRTIFLIRGVDLPPGCAPSSTDVLLVYGNPPGAPELYVRQGIKARNGVTPRNAYPETIDGEPWMRFSSSQSYEPGKPLSSFVYGRIARFGRAE